MATAIISRLCRPSCCAKAALTRYSLWIFQTQDERTAIWLIHLSLRKQDRAQFDLPKLVDASKGFSGSEIEQAVVAGLYRALYHKQPLTTDLLIQELSHTVPLSVTRSERSISCEPPRKAASLTFDERVPLFVVLIGPLSPGAHTASLSHNGVVPGALAGAERSYSKIEPYVSIHQAKANPSDSFCL